MAVLIEGISVVIRVEALRARFPGGWQGFLQIVPNRTLCADGEIARLGFMEPENAEALVTRLQQGGLVFLRDDEFVDLAVVQPPQTPAARCPWLEFARVPLNGNPAEQVYAGRLAGSALDNVVTPSGWSFDGSVTQQVDLAANAPPS